MRKILTAISLTFVLALPLGGCLTASDGTILNPVTVLTSSVQNPVTRTQVAAIVQTWNTALIPARKYVRLRTCKSTETFLSTSGGCGDYNIKLQIKAAVVEGQKWRRELVTFVAQNNSISATVAYNELNRVLDILRSAPNARG